MEQRLTGFEVSNFRSHADRRIELGPLTAFIGPNGAGKTNLLEALWFLATTRSFRAAREIEMIAWGQAGLRVAANDYEIRLVQEPRVQKLVMVRGVPQKPLDYLGEIRTILFTPDSLAVVSGAPGDRRRFVDTILSQRNQLVAHALVAYRHVLVQRNALLRLISFGQAAPAELVPWNQQLVAHGETITTAREGLIAFLNEVVPDHYRDISERPDDTLRLEYQPSSGRSTEGFLERLERLEQREIQSQMTLVGPHRDDFLVLLNGYPAAPHASRGEIRSIVLALKWGESAVMHDDEHPPLLLLDDLFSELDEHHRAALERLLATHQTVCTTTDRNNLPPALRHQASVIELEGRT